MIITKGTELTQVSLLFADGEGGSYRQEYKIQADGKDTGVYMTITGKTGDGSERKFSVVGKATPQATVGMTYDKVKDAFIAAGHKWERAREG